jgi:hypothetical protein
MCLSAYLGRISGDTVPFKGQSHPDIVLYFRVEKIKSILPVGPLMVFKFLTLGFLRYSKTFLTVLVKTIYNFI